MLPLSLSTKYAKSVSTFGKNTYPLIPFCTITSNVFSSPWYA